MRKTTERATETLDRMRALLQQEPGLTYKVVSGKLGISEDYARKIADRNTTAIRVERPKGGARRGSPHRLYPMAAREPTAIPARSTLRQARAPVQKPKVDGVDRQLAELFPDVDFADISAASASIRARLEDLERRALSAEAESTDLRSRLERSSGPGADVRAAQIVCEELEQVVADDPVALSLVRVLRRLGA